MDEPELYIRAGLIEALARRASFSRRHLGAYASPRDGDDVRSEATPAAWHAGDRVDFAWSDGDRVVFARFGPTGDSILPPRLIGRGRLPRVTARGDRTAVAWMNEQGSAIRLCDGTEWRAESAVPGRQPDLALAPDGTVHVATTAGQFRLSDGNVSTVVSRELECPAIALHDDAPALAYRRDGRIFCDDAEIGAGDQPSILVTPAGVHVAYVDSDAIVVRRRDNGRWSDGQSLPRRGNWPALARGANEEIRLTYVGVDQHDADALWLLRLPDEERILIPSIAGNVTAAWLTVDFGLSGLRTSYQAHDVLVSINDRPLHLFRNTLPAGRYLFRVNPHHLKMSHGGPAKNSVTIDSQHMNRGHYRVASDFRLTVRTPWRERWAFASSEKEVLESLEAAPVNHGRPDLTILANDLKLPVAIPDEETVDLHVLVANVGESPSESAQLQVSEETKIVTTIAIPPLEPDDQWPVTIALHHEDHRSVTFRLIQREPDFDPTNDSMTITLWPKRAGERVRDFSLPSATGESLIRLSDHGGNVVLLNFWRTSCAWSQRETERLVRLWRQHREQGLVILGIADETSDTVAEVPSYLRRHGLEWPIALNDQGEFVRELLRHGSGETPGNYLVSRDGELTYLGLDRSEEDWQRLEQAVSRAIARPVRSRAAIRPREEPPPPPLALQDVDGVTVTLDQFPGKALVVNFFTADTCGWAGRALAKIHRHYAARGVQVIGINLYDDADAIRRCRDEYGLDFPLLRGDRTAQLAWLGGDRAWGTFFITRDRRVVKVIFDSIEKGLEDVVFPRYAASIAARDPH